MLLSSERQLIQTATTKRDALFNPSPKPMRYRRIIMKTRLNLLALVIFVLAITPAFAGTITFTGTGPYHYAGEPSFQYDFSDGITRMCINNDRFISTGETWEVNVLPVTTLAEEQAAWLFLHAGDGSDSDYQGAVWYLFNPATTLTTGAASLVSQVQGMSFTSGEFADVQLYVPTTNQTGWTNGIPQAFLGQTPEPGTLLLIGSGVLGIWAKRKRALS